ncbi:MAG: alginate lyase family protein [Chloroflexi bacterium]|nr:alginate lyase family protein [Chloroflexota bacterium]
MRNKLKLARQIWRYLGPAWVVFRLKYAIQMRSGWLRRRMPAFEWQARPLDDWLSPVPADPGVYQTWVQRGRFFFDILPDFSSDVPWNTQNVVEEANAILVGRWRYFEHTVYEVGCPPDWHLNPMTGQRIAADRHWTQISDFGQGDIKLIWEASRFGVVYTLVRAYAVTRDERYPDAFWTLVEDWAKKNPPHQGANWKCGQEATFRVMAWCFGLHGFAQAARSTPERFAQLTGMIAVHAERIERNIAYARSLKNNHGISEAVGLWTVGQLFPMFKRAAIWREKGRRIIQAEVDRQVYTDGAYVQHSLNYHRLMLHDLIWALRLGEINGDRLPQPVYAKFEKAVEFLYQLLDMESGSVPNYGANDGALILPLNNCDYVDFRPVLQASHYLLKKKKWFGPGPWDEDLMWLFGLGASDGEVEPAAQPQADLTALLGGYYTLRDKHSWVMLRCAPYHDRPSHADQLHVDLWWRGINVACDAGAYLYHAESPWDNGLAATRVHNTVMVDGQDQMWRYSRFLWLAWAQGKILHRFRSQTSDLGCWEGQHDGYRRLTVPAVHQRGVLRLGSDHWLIVDELSSASEHDYRLHWLFPDLPYQWDESRGILALDTPQGHYQAHIMAMGTTGSISLVRNDENSVHGWRSRYYAHKEPAVSVSLTVRNPNARFLTLFGPAESSLQVSENEVLVQWADQEARIMLDGQRSLVRAVVWNGNVKEEVQE